MFRELSGRRLAISQRAIDLLGRFGRNLVVGFCASSPCWLEQLNSPKAQFG
jgi:hypothetical protein